MADTIQVTPKMNRFIEWASEKGQEEITRLVNERLAMLKEECSLKPGMPDSEGYVWNDLLEPSDSTDQWKGGGDCNKCRRYSYCKKQCRANRLLKQITTPFLYNLYLTENPDAAAEEAANMTPEQMLKALGAEDGSLEHDDHIGDQTVVS